MRPSSGEQGKILHEAFARQAELLAELSKLTNLNGELRDANGMERQLRAKAEKSFEEANYQLQVRWPLIATDCHGWPRMATDGHYEFRRGQLPAAGEIASKCHSVPLLMASDDL